MLDSVVVKSVRTMIGTLGIVASVACGLTRVEAPDGNVVRVENDTERTLAVLAFDREASSLVDPIPQFATDDRPSTVVLPREALELPATEIVGFTEGRGLTLFVYEVVDGSATYRTSIGVPGEDLQTMGFVISIALEDGRFVRSPPV